MIEIIVSLIIYDLLKAAVRLFGKLCNALATDIEKYVYKKELEKELAKMKETQPQGERE